MSDANFSGLIYRIIGKPERWHDDYIVDMFQKYMDETDALNDPKNMSEIEAGEQILAALQQGNVALNAFNSLLDKSRFKTIILDEKLETIYKNSSAENLLQYLQNPNKPNTLKPEVKDAIESALGKNDSSQNSSIVALGFFDENGDQLYLRSIYSSVQGGAVPSLFHNILVLDNSQEHLNLNPQLVALYGLTKKEQDILARLVHGLTIKEIAEKSFVTEGTTRTHLKSIFKKTATNSQVALISLILNHESQVLDSYFNSDITTASGAESSEFDFELTLSSGQKIAYADYGPKDGRPIVVFHSGFGSRLAIPHNHQELCERTNRRVIVPDRPGLGKTPFIENHPQNWNAQLSEFLSVMGIEEYDVLGSIIACQMAVSYAAQADSRMKRLILTSPIVLNDDSHAEYLTEILAPAARYVRLSPTFAKEIYELWLKSVTLNLDAHYPAILDASIGSAEREQFERDGVINLLTDVFKEGARQSLDGILHEMVYCMTPLNLELSRFNKPLDVWFGTEDKRITREGVEAIFSEFENCNLHIREGYSEHLYYSLFEEIMRY